MVGCGMALAPIPTLIPRVRGRELLSVPTALDHELVA